MKNLTRMTVVAFVVFICLSLTSTFGIGLPVASAQVGEPPVPTPKANSPYFTSTTQTLPSGQSVEKYVINGPSTPPSGNGAERAARALPQPDAEMGINVLTVPAYDWVFGCSSVSGAMIAGYYDRNGFPNMYTGPTDLGVAPLDNSSWPTWTDGTTTYPNLPLAASHQWVDGRTTRGSIDDYWVQYGSASQDPYLTNGWTQHTWADAIGDYMKTSQSAYQNTDGATTFYNYLDSSRLTCADMATGGISDKDGTYGRKLFYEARGYTVSDCYSQKTDNRVSGGFSFAQYKAEIDAGHPVMLNLEGHTVVGVGYDDTSNTVYLHDTWDHSNHTMTWGGSYETMALLSVSVVHPQTATLPGNFNRNGPANGATGISVGSTLSWGNSIGATSYEYCVDTVNNNLCDGTWTSTGSVASARLGNLRDGVNYWLVRARNAAGTTEADGGAWWSFAYTSYRSYLSTIKAYPPAPVWSTIVSTDFEGAWPGVWNVFDNDGATGGEYSWGRRNCRAYAGSNSGWGVGAGAQGSGLGCGASYPNDVDSWMVYGPFSLSGALAADVRFKLWLNSEANYDGVCRLASTNGSEFWGSCTSGYTGGWIDRTLNLASVDGLGNLLGQSNVWIAVVFSSDYSNTYAEGGYVDNVVLRKCTGIGTCPAGSAEMLSSDSQAIEAPVHKILVR